MKTFKLLSLTVLAVLFSHCGTTEPTTNSPIGNSVLQVTRILDTVHGKFYELATSNLSSTPGQILVMTSDWVKTQPDVLDAYWFDSTYIEIKLKSGLRTTFMLYREGINGTSLTRGGTPGASKAGFQQTTKSANIITNKKVLIYAPFVSGTIPEPADLYKDGELDHLVNLIKNSGKDIDVTRHEYSEATLKDVESFGDYGLVILSTHGLPDAFFTGQFVVYDPKLDTSEALIKEQADFTLGPGGYEKVSSGNLRFCHGINIANIQNWQEFIEGKVERQFRVIVDAAYINQLPSMPNTVILGNMCYSGWSAAGEFTSPKRGKTVIDDPIKTAFTNRNLISYYSYGYDNGTSDPVDNNFCKKMEDSLVRALIIDGDSTGNAYLNSAGVEYTAGKLGEKISPTMPLKHSGHDNYSYESCVEEFTDIRDTQKYKAVCIGKQTWMAENLRYNAPGSVAYDQKESNADVYGRLYDWATLMQGASESTTNPSKVQGVCPKGWHVPSKAEWLQLANAINHKGGDLKDSKLWLPPNTDATNLYGFNALGGGNYEPPGFGFHKLNEYGFWWTTQSENGTGTKRVVFILAYNYNELTRSEANQDLKASCRCVKD